MNRDPHAQSRAEVPADGAGVALHDEVQVRSRPACAEEGVSYRAPDGPHRVARPSGQDRRDGVAGQRVPGRRIDVVEDSYDPLSEKLPASAPIADPALIAALARWEHLTVPQLEEEFRLNEDRFRAWVQDPANAGRPMQEFPEYIDRLAIDALIERRTWME